MHEPGGGAVVDAESSARLAEQTLPAYGVDPIRIAEVARLVRVTAYMEQDSFAIPEARLFRNAVSRMMPSHENPPAT